MGGILRDCEIFANILQLELLEADLAVHDGQGVHPHPPAPVLELDGVVQQHPEQREHHVADLALLLGGRVDHSQGDQPFLKQQIYRISRFCAVDGDWRPS